MVSIYKSNRMVASALSSAALFLSLGFASAEPSRAERAAITKAKALWASAASPGAHTATLEATIS